MHPPYDMGKANVLSEYICFGFMLIKQISLSFGGIGLIFFYLATRCLSSYKFLPSILAQSFVFSLFHSLSSLKPFFAASPAVLVLSGFTCLCFQNM